MLAIAFLSDRSGGDTGSVLSFCSWTTLRTVVKSTRLLQGRKHREGDVISDLAEALQKRRLASTEQLHPAAELAFLQGKKRAHAVVRIGRIQIEEDDVGIVILDTFAEARAVHEFDGVDAEATQGFGEPLQITEVGVHHEAKRVACAGRWFGSANCQAVGRHVQPASLVAAA